MPASCPGGLKSPGRGRQRIPQTGGSIASIAILWPYSRFPLQLPDPARHLRPSPPAWSVRVLFSVFASQRLPCGHRHLLRPSGSLVACCPAFLSLLFATLFHPVPSLASVSSFPFLFPHLL